jgi:ABC-2 type transport system ATP-binding protein
MHDAIIEAEGLVKTFGGKLRALDGLTLTVQPGSIYGLLGPNGAGKTTLIRILATLLPPDAGTARIAGIDIRTDPAGVRAQIGLAGQYAAVDDYLTGRENVEMIGRLYGLPRRQARRRAAEVLERIHLAAVADRRVKTYSGGCAAAWTWPRPWSAARRCCSWTNPPLAWTRPAEGTYGR